MSKLKTLSHKFIYFLLNFIAAAVCLSLNPLPEVLEARDPAPMPPTRPAEFGIVPNQAQISEGGLEPKSTSR